MAVSALITPLQEKLKPWERREKESAEQWNAFQLYRETPKEDRNFTKLAEHLNVQYQVLISWSRKNAWRTRIAEYDAYIHELRGIRSETRRLEASVRHAESASKLHSKVVEKINRLRASDIKPNLIAPLLRVAVETERLALGEAPPQQSGSVVVGTADGTRVGISWGNNTPAWLPQPKQPISQDTTTHHRSQGTRGRAAQDATPILEELSKLLDSTSTEEEDE
jgi:hypothetical protein